MHKAIGVDLYNQSTTGDVSKTLNSIRSDADHVPCVIVKRTAYGFFPQMKAEGMAFKEEKSGAVVIGTNPGFQNGVLIVYESNGNDCE